MIRLALMLILFVSLAVASAIQADTGPSPTPSATEAEPSPTALALEPRDERNSRPRWIPRQARRRLESGGPAVTPYPVLPRPVGISNLSF